MKIVEIKCPSCGGKLKMEGKETKLVTCEYCGNQFLLDDEKKQNKNFHGIMILKPQMLKEINTPVLIAVFVHLILHHSPLFR